MAYILICLATLVVVLVAHIKHQQCEIEYFRERRIEGHRRLQYTEACLDEAWWLMTNDARREYKQYRDAHAKDFGIDDVQERGPL